MSRIQEIDSTGSVKYQRYAPKTQIQYDPASDEGVVNFFVERYLVIDDQIESRVAKEEVLSYPLMSLATRFFADGAPDPVTGASLEQVSAAGVMLLIKRAFNRLIDEKFESEIVVSPSTTLVRVDRNNAFGNGQDPIELTVEVRDENDATLSLAGGLKNVRFEPSLGTVQGEVTNNMDGTYSQSIVSDETGLSEVKVFVNNVEMTRKINIEFI